MHKCHAGHVESSPSDRFIRIAGLASSAALLLIIHPALADCVPPHIISNGQVADASKVMADITAVAACADSHKPAGPENSIQVNGGSGVASGVGPLTNGQVVVGSTGAAPQAANLTAGPGITITNRPGAITISSTGSSSGSGGADIAMALGAAWAKEMVLNGRAFTAGTARSAKADLGAYVGMRLMANTNSSFANRVISSATYTVPANALAFVVQGHFNNEQRADPRYYGVRLNNVTKNRVAAGAIYDELRGVPDVSRSGERVWLISNDGLLSTGVGGSANDVSVSYPVAGEAGDVLQLEAWSAGDGAYRVQDMAVFLVIVGASTGEMIH